MDLLLLYLYWTRTSVRESVKRVGAKRQQRMKPASLSAEDLCVARLAEFFPEAMPVRIPVRVTRKGASRTAVTEDTTIEFGTQQEVLFASGLSLDFEERIHLENSDGSLDIEARVVAMQLHQGKTAVAARFMKNVTNWIIRK